jgi:hypothetical protein
MLGLVVAKYLNGIELRHIMNGWQDDLTKNS